MFFPNSAPKVHLRRNRLCLREYLNTVILCICAHLSGSHTGGSMFYASASDDSQREKQAEKRYSHQKRHKYRSF